MSLPVVVGALSAGIGLAWATAPADTALRVVQEVLPNGLTVVVAPLSTPGVAAVQTWVDAGSGAEVAPGSSGIAHLLEHLATVEQPGYGELLERSGAIVNAWTWNDNTVYHLVVPSPAVGTVLEAEARRLAGFSMTEADVAREVGAVHGEWRFGESDPHWQLSAAIDAAALAGHPYAHDTIGLDADLASWPSDVAGTRQKAQDFLAAWYVPQHVRLVVAGDVDPEAVLEAARRSYGALPAGSAPSPDLPPWAEPPAEPLRVAVGWAAGVTLVDVGWVVPGFHPASGESAVAAVVEELLLGQVAALRRQLVEEGPALDLTGGSPGFRAAHRLSVRAELPLGVQAPAIEAEVVAAVQALALLDDPAVRAAAEHVSRKLLLRLGRPADVADALGFLAVDPADPDPVGTWLRSLAAVDAAAVRVFVERHLAPERRVVGVLQPGPEAP